MRVPALTAHARNDRPCNNEDIGAPAFRGNRSKDAIEISLNGDIGVFCIGSFAPGP